VKIGVIGIGYVGLVTSACFAEMGNTVTCVDTDEEKVQKLNRVELPIFEPGLDVLVARNHKEGRLQFTPSLADAVSGSEALFIAVGTPPSGDGTANLDHVLGVARQIGRTITGPTVVVTKSTVPVGTTQRVGELVGEELGRRGAGFGVEVVSNPEFLKEGAAVNDFMRPDEIVIGSDSQQAIEFMHHLYAPFMRQQDIMMVMGLRDAEMTKYALNAMLATRISFMNEIAELCERLDVDVENVRRGIGSDSRIGHTFIYPGCGFGGSCLPKDLRALMGMGRQAGVELEILEKVERRNDRQKRRLFDKLQERFGSSLDDVREASSAALIELLIGHGARVNAFDPIATESFRKAANPDWISKGCLCFFDDQYDALAGASALILVTEWRQFRNPDFSRIKHLLATPVIFDGRNQYEPDDLRKQGFEYFGIGR
jgi:UDPglucose 6-dehydrogenase